MNQGRSDQNSTLKENISSRNDDLQNQSNPIYKDTLKNVKIFIPAENYDSKLSFEQNLQEGKVKLIREMPFDDFGKTVDPILKTHGAETNKNSQQNINSSCQNSSSYRNSVIENDSFSSSSMCATQSSKQHICDVCYQSFSQRRDLALHYLLHSEKEKRRAAKARNKCEICRKILALCNCKRISKESYPEYSNLPSYFSISELPNSSTLFIKTESNSGSSNVIKRHLFNCPECEQTFGLESQLKQHLLVHKRKRRSNPEGQSSLSYSTETNSGNTFVTRELFGCPDCEQSFGLESQLKQHVLVHKRQRAKNSKRAVFLCNLCQNKFEDNSSLMFHVATIHPDSIPSI